MFNIRKFFQGLGLVPVSSSAVDTKGELEVLDSSGKLNYHNGSSASPMVTEAHSATLTNKTIDADNNTITNIENADIKAAAAIDATKIANGSVDNTEFQYLNGVTSAIQTQLNNKVGTADVAVLTNKTIDGDDNTLQDISITSLKTDAGAPSTFISRDGSGVVISTKAVPTGTVVGTSDTQTLTGKTIDGDDNTVQDLPLTAIKTNLTDASKFIVRDASGIPVSNTKAVPSGDVVGTSDTQTLTNKTVNDDSFTIQDNADNTKKAQFQASGITTGTTRTYTLPDANTTIVGTDVTQTLTNKTLTTPSTDIITWDDQGSTPSNPSAGFYKLYFKTDGKLYRLNSSGTEVEVGSAGGLASSDPSSVQTSNYTVQASDNGKTILVDSSGGSISITLPSPIANFKVIIKDVTGSAATNNISVLPAGATEKMDNIVGNDIINTAYTAVGYHCNGTDWFRIAVYTGSMPISTARGFFAGGGAGANSNVIDYVTIVTTGNATDFGDLTVARNNPAGCASQTRGLFGGGSQAGDRNEIDYITMASAGNATDFGDLTVARSLVGACSSSTRGVWAGGDSAGTPQNVMDYVTIASTGNAADFGDLTVSRFAISGLASPTRGLFGGGYTAGSTTSNVIDYITIASTGNATDFGDLTVSRGYTAASSNSTRGVWGGGDIVGVLSNVIDYVTIASTGNATDFGDLTVSRYGPAGCSSSLRSLFGGGNNNITNQNVIDYVTIASVSNATDFGDLTVARNTPAACSSGHGGLT